MKQATTSVFNQAEELYAAAGRNFNFNLNDEIKAYNALIEQYDFRNQAFADDSTGKWGVMRCDGLEFVPARYDEIRFFKQFSVPFDECLVIARRDGRDYLVNNRGEEVLEADEIKPNIASIDPVVFRLGDKWGMALASGSVYIKPVYDSVEPDANGFTFLTLGSKKGFIALGHIVEPIFDDITVDRDSNLVVTLDGRRGYIDENDGFTTSRSEAYYNFDMFL